jgi:membrane protease YdiL (CAAX protease family)
MSTCPNCGKEHGDDVTHCAIDHTSIVVKPEPPFSDRQSEAKNVGLTYPEYKWSARDGVKFIGTVILFGFILTTLNREIGLHFRNFYDSAYGDIFSSGLHFGVIVFAAAYFARTDTWIAFLNGFGLNKTPTYYLPYGIIAAFATRLFGHMLWKYGWSHGVSNYDVTSFYHKSGFESYLYLVPSLIFAPLFEETAYRGFLYKALRGSFSVVVSVVLVVAWAEYRHWNQFSGSFPAVLDLSFLTMVQCYLREKSGSLWDCIICHFVFNASAIFL